METKVTVPNDQTVTEMAAEHSVLPEATLAPATKLDADNYNAEDLEGVTESLFGSGNLNYLTLQGRQTDAMLAAHDFDALAAHEANAASAEDVFGSGHRLPALDADSGAGAAGKLAADDAALARAGFGEGVAAISRFASGGGSAALAGRSEALFSDGTPGLPGEGRDGLDAAGLDGVGRDGENGLNGNNGNDGNDGRDGNTPEPPDPPSDPGDPGTDPDIDLSAHNDLGAPLIDLNLDPIENIIGDIDVSIGQTLTPDGVGLDVHAVIAGIPLVDTTLNPGIPGVTNIVFPLVDDLVNLADPDSILHDPVGGVGALADSIIASTGLENIPSIEALLQPLSDATAPVTDLLTPVLDTVNGLVNSEGLQGPVTALGEVAEQLADATGIDLTSVLGELSPATDMIAPTLNGLLETVNELAQDPANAVDALLGETGLGAPDLSDAVGEVLETVLGDTGAGGLLENPLGIVGEALNPILGGAGVDLQPVADAVGGALGDISDIGGILEDPVGTVENLAEGLLSALPGQGETPPGGDTDLFVHNDLGLPQVDVNLDPVENLLGDIDIGVPVTHDADSVTAGVAALALGAQLVDEVVDVPVQEGGAILDMAESILGETASLSELAEGAIDSLLPAAEGGGLTSLLPGVEDVAAWPQAPGSGLSPDIADTLSSLIGGIGDAAGALPAPEGSVSEGLGLLDIGGDGGGILSGLGGLGGGLFG